MKKILVINAGSSSIKFKLFDTDLEYIASGICDRIFVDGLFKIEYLNSNNELIKKESKTDFANHTLAIKYLFDSLIDNKIIDDYNDVIGVGHRIVHGVTYFNESTIIDDEKEKLLEKTIEFAPLHNKPELDVIKIVRNLIPNSVQVGVFDTAFHSTMPKLNYTYAVPKEWINEYHIRRYGFHGTSYRYINEKMEAILNKKNLNLIVCHLGNGASICAIKNGLSYDTSMGFTPLSGLVMGTRSGDLDPSIITHMGNYHNVNIEKISEIIHKESGMKGLCGKNDFRDIEQMLDHDEDSKFAWNLFVKRICEYIVKYQNELENKIDAIVFTGGIGENANKIRQDVINSIYTMNVKLSPENDKKLGEYALISTNDSIKIFMIRTNEELMIAKDVINLISFKKK